MNEAKEKLLKLINEIPDNEVADVLDFAELLPELNLYKELTSEDKEIAIQYWDSDIDEEVLDYMTSENKEVTIQQWDNDIDEEVLNYI